MLQWLGSLADLQFIQMLVESLNPHCPRKPEEPDSMKDCPSMGLNYAICRGDRAERILFALVGDHSAGSTTPIFSNDTIENEHWYSVLLSLNNIPDLCNSFAAGLKVGNPTRKRRTHFEVGGVPRLRSQGAQVLKLSLIHI